MIVRREWAMPSKNTFSIKPITKLIEKYIEHKSVIVDPFANGSKLGTITNDLDTTYDTDYHLDALEFLKLMETNGVDVVLYDPPYSERQLYECYNPTEQSIGLDNAKNKYLKDIKQEFNRMVKIGGYVLSFGWSSEGVGEKYGFELVEVLTVAHGGWHNDTICTVEKKVS